LDFGIKTEKIRKRCRSNRIYRMNDYTGLATALLAGVGIGDLPTVVQPDLIREDGLLRS